MKETFVMYKSYIDAVNKISGEADKLELLLAICNYSMTGVEPTFESYVADLVFTAIKPSIDGAMKRYQTSVENGKKGGAPKGNNNAKKQPKTTQEQPKLTQEQPKETTQNNLYVYEDVYEDVDVDVYKDVDVDVYESEIKDLMKSKKLSRTEAIKYINGLPSVEEIFIKAEEKRKEIFGVTFDDI